MTKLNFRSILLPMTRRTVKLSIVFVFAGVLLVFLGQDLPPALSQAIKQTGKQTTGGTIGKDCRQCHLAIVESYALNAHGKSGKFLDDERRTSCENCHGNGEKHIDSKKKEDILMPTKMTSAEANSSCLKCHSQDRHTFAWKGGQHDRNDMSCLSCHSEHHAKSEEKMLANSTVEETCLRCHMGVRKAVFQRSTHLFRTEHREMKVGCLSCHNPHGGEGDKMLVAETVNNTCYQCHAEKRGPFLWDHPPVRENCMNCHSPHGSSNAKLLTARVSLSCQQCHIHMLPRHSTTAGKPMDIWSLNRGCVNCHAQVHGSNHPGGRTLTR